MRVLRVKSDAKNIDGYHESVIRICDSKQKRIEGVNLKQRGTWRIGRAPDCHAGHAYASHACVPGSNPGRMHDWRMHDWR